MDFLAHLRRIHILLDQLDVCLLWLYLLAEGLEAERAIAGKIVLSLLLLTDEADQLIHSSEDWKVALFVADVLILLLLKHLHLFGRRFPHVPHAFLLHDNVDYRSPLAFVLCDVELMHCEDARLQPFVLAEQIRLLLGQLPYLLLLAAEEFLVLLEVVLESLVFIKQVPEGSEVRIDDFAER